MTFDTYKQYVDAMNAFDELACFYDKHHHYTSAAAVRGQMAGFRYKSFR